MHTITSCSRHASDCKSIGQLAADFVVRVLESERRFTAAGWLNPVELHNAGYRYQLRGDRFGDSVVGFVYAYIAACAEQNVTPDVDKCLRIAEQHDDVPLDALDVDWLFRLLLETDIEAGRVEEYAREVVRLADIREGAARHYLSEFAKLCVDERHFRISVHPVGGVRMAQTILRKKRNGRTKQRIAV